MTPTDPGPPPQTPDDFAADAIVVLGGGVHADGTLPRVARARVERAAEIFHGGIAPRLVLSGLCGLTEPEPPVSEAAAMAAYAAELGVPREALLLEDESRDTLGNAYFTRERYLEPNGWSSIRVVTSDFHLSRAAWVFRKVLGGAYDFSFVSAASGFSPRELIDRAVEECRILIFLNEWLEALEEADDAALDRLMVHEHPGYSDAPLLTHEQMQRRLDEISQITRIAGGRGWIATGSGPGDWGGAMERRAGAERRARRPFWAGRR
ncbi:MAG TPA: YdcF family protein [Longimicrobiaceae bacterium]|nr:YdcF family protein [Longimicrobiaceae bacterium]